jgi:hypothetical protein
MPPLPDGAGRQPAAGLPSASRRWRRHPHLPTPAAGPCRLTQSCCHHRQTPGWGPIRPVPCERRTPGCAGSTVKPRSTTVMASVRSRFVSAVRRRN